jgi:anti-sigma regulatory factor (Ser/Thr protein kinase)
MPRSPKRSTVGENETLHPGRCLWDAASGISLASALAPPTGCLIDTGAPGDVCASDLAVLPEADKLFASVRNATAYRLPVARLFIGALAERIEIDQELYFRMEIALQEAIMNAVIHGNLGIGQIARDGLTEISEIETILAERLASPDRAVRRVRIEARWTPRDVLISICDEGAGYVPDWERHLQVGPASHGRRGLSIMHAVARSIDVSDHGRCLTLSFAR